jgi:hypothetical protein
VRLRKALVKHYLKTLDSPLFLCPYRATMSKKYQQFLKASRERREAIIRAASFFGTKVTAKKFKLSRQRVNQIINGK